MHCQDLSNQRNRRKCNQGHSDPCADMHVLTKASQADGSLGTVAAYEFWHELAFGKRDRIAL